MPKSILKAQVIMGYELENFKQILSKRAKKKSYFPFCYFVKALQVNSKCRAPPPSPNACIHINCAYDLSLSLSLNFPSAKRIL